MNVPDDKLTRWHQNFDVDAVADIPTSSLPQAPEIKTFVTAKDVLGISKTDLDYFQVAII